MISLSKRSVICFSLSGGMDLYREQVMPACILLIVALPTHWPTRALLFLSTRNRATMAIRPNNNDRAIGNQLTEILGEGKERFHARQSIVMSETIHFNGEAKELHIENINLVFRSRDRRMHCYLLTYLQCLWSPVHHI